MSRRFEAIIAEVERRIREARKRAVAAHDDGEWDHETAQAGGELGALTSLHSWLVEGR